MTQADLDELDPMLIDMLPGNVQKWITDSQATQEKIRNLEAAKKKAEKDFEDLSLALTEWSNTTGYGITFFDELKICVEQLRIARGEAVQP